jgi:hypothetical protein
MMKTFASLIWILMTCFFPLTGSAYTQQDCLVCHAADTGSSQKRIQPEEFESSIHHQAGIGCRDCHTGIQDAAHETGVTIPSSVNCNDCHEQENLHGSAAQQNLRPQCHDCHTRHNIRVKTDEHSAIHTGNLADTCSRCHPGESGRTDILSFLPSLKISTHEKQDFSQVYRMDNCIGCHQGRAVHGSQETVNDQNCAVCHLDESGKSTLMGILHPGTAQDRKSAVFAASLIHFAFFGLIVIFGLGVRVKKIIGSRR